MYHAQKVPEERLESYFELITHLVELNNTFASELIEFLEQKQITGIFDRFNTIFLDLFEKFKRNNIDLKNSEENRNRKEAWKVCQVCHEDMENNRI
jgi:hypothetical protein